MFHVPEQWDHDWPHIPRASAQPIENVQWFWEACLKLNPEKCQLFQKEIRYLGHMVSPEEITIDLKNLRAVQECLTLKKKHNIRSLRISTEIQCLCTDHFASVWLMGFENLEGHTAHRIQHLQEYNYIFKHRLDQKHNSVKALSRWPFWEGCHKVEVQADVKQVQAIAAVATASWDTASLRIKQLNDQDVGPILEKIETGPGPE